MSASCREGELAFLAQFGLGKISDRIIQHVAVAIDIIALRYIIHAVAKHAQAVNVLI